MSATDAPVLTNTAPQAVRQMLVEDAATYLNVRPETIRRRVRAGHLQAHRAAVHGRSVLLVQVPTRWPDKPHSRDAQGTEPHHDATKAHDDAPATAVSLNDISHVYDAHLADMRAILIRVENSHRDELERMREAHRATLEAHAGVLDVLTEANRHAMRRIDDLVTASRRQWWRLW